MSIRTDNLMVKTCPKCLSEMVRNDFVFKKAQYKCKNEDCNKIIVYDRKYSCPNCMNGRLIQFGKGTISRGRLLARGDQDNSEEKEYYYQCDLCEIVKIYETEL